MAASNAVTFRGACFSSTWIPRQIRNIIACSQTLYFFKGFIDRQRKEVVVGVEKIDVLYFSFSRSALLARFARELADVFEKNEKKNKTTSVYRLGI